MRLMERYLIRHILGLTAIVGLGLLAIYTFVTFIAELGDAGRNGIGFAATCAYAALSMPASLYLLMPIIALLGTLLGIGLLAGQGELTAMRAAGVSTLRFGGASLLAGALLGAATFALGNWLVPPAQHWAAQLRAGAHRDPMVESLWLRDAQNVIRIGHLRSADRIDDVTIYHLTADSRIDQILDAQHGDYHDGRWALAAVRMTQLNGVPARSSADSGMTSSISAQDRMVWNGELNPEVLRLYLLETDSLTLRGLDRLIAYFKANHLDAAKYQLLLWRKLVEPFTVMAMMLFAVPFVVGSARDTGAGQRLLFGVMIGIAFYVLNKVSASYGALYHWPPAVAASLPTAGLATIAGWRLQIAR